MNKWVSEWLLFMARTSLFSTRWWWGPLCSRPTRWVGFFIVLAHWNNSPRVDMSLHSDTLVWFRANQSLLFLLNAACLAEKQQIPILMSLVWHDWARPTIYRRRAHKPLCHRCGSKCIRIKTIYQWVCECLLFFNANSAIFRLYHDEKKLIFNEMMKDWLIDWCLTATLAVFQLYCGINDERFTSISKRSDMSIRDLSPILLFLTCLNQHENSRQFPFNSQWRQKLTAKLFLTLWS
jgi:hypothetical protein